LVFFLLFLRSRFILTCPRVSFFVVSFSCDEPPAVRPRFRLLEARDGSFSAGLCEAVFSAFFRFLGGPDSFLRNRHFLFFGGVVVPPLSFILFPPKSLPAGGCLSFSGAVSFVCFFHSVFFCCRYLSFFFLQRSAVARIADRWEGSPAPRVWI